MRAAVRFGQFEKVIGWNPHPEMLTRLADTATELGLPFEAVDLLQLGTEADVIISITSSTRRRDRPCVCARASRWSRPSGGTSAPS